MLLNVLLESLGEFGKHVPTLTPSPTTAATPSGSKSDATPPKGAGAKTAPPPPTGQPHPLFMDGGVELDDIFSSELAAKAEAQLGEAMKMLSSENPELWEQFETLAKSMEMDAGPVPPVFGTASKGESSVDANSGAARGENPPKSEGTGGGSGSTLEQKLDDTIKRMQDNATRLGVSLFSMWYMCSFQPSHLIINPPQVHNYVQQG